MELTTSEVTEPNRALALIVDKQFLIDQCGRLDVLVFVLSTQELS